MTRETKILALTGATVSDEGFGSFSGYASVWNTKDSQGDRVVRGAYTETIPQFIERGFIAWSHDWAAPVATIASAVEDDHGLFIVADFHSDAQSQIARTRTAERLARGKFMGLSIGYQTDDAEQTPDARLLKKITLFETSLVTVPALASAGVTAAKAGPAEAKGAIKPHSTGTTDAGWDAGQMWKNCGSDETALRAACAWIDPDKDPATKAAYRFIHHMVSADGAVGAANETACSSGIGVLNGGRGGTTIPDGDRQGVWNHLAKHLKDAGKTPPDLKSVGVPAGAKYGGFMGGEPPEGSYEALSEDIGEAFRETQIPAGTDAYVYVVATYPTSAVVCVMTTDGDEPTFWNVAYVVGADGESITLGAPQQVEAETTFTPVKGTGLGYDLHAARVESAVQELVNRTRAGSAVRYAKEGRPISEARRTRMAAIRDGLRTSADDLHAILEETAPAPKPKAIDVSHELAAFLAFEARRNGVAVELPV